MSRHKDLRPENLQIVVRRIDFDYYNALRTRKYWFNDDPVISHFINALQATFPEGEKLFIQAAIDGAAQIMKKQKIEVQLKRDMKHFIKQEAMHSKQHAKWTDALINLGYSGFKRYDNQLKNLNKFFRKYVPAVLRLSITAAAEHYTASIAFIFTHVRPDLLIHSNHSFRGLLLYHAIEELEHKSVCYELYQKLSGSYILRVFGMILSTIDLIINIFIRFRYLMKKDRLWTMSNKRKFYKFLLGSNGIIQGLIYRIKDYFKLSFHPWENDERKLVNAHFRKYQEESGIKPFII